MADPTDDRFEEIVRQTAYALWEQDGRPEGQDLRYWYRAVEQARQPRPVHPDTSGSSSLVGEERQIDDNQDDLGRPLT